MTKQEFDKIVAKYEEHKKELNYQYELGKLHGALEVMNILIQVSCVPKRVFEYLDKQIKKV